MTIDQRKELETLTSEQIDSISALLLKYKKKYSPATLVNRDFNDVSDYYKSKIGGLGYYPKDQIYKYPLSQSGKPMILLLQLNLSELPKVPIVDDIFLPENGIVQIYIDWESDLYIDNLDSQEDLKVRYFPQIENDISKIETDFNFINSDFYAKTFFKLKTTRSGLFLTFNTHLEYMYPTFTTNEFQLLCDEIQIIIPGFDLNDYLNLPVNELLIEQFNIFGHRFLGYPMFAQSDIRESDDDIFILQLDSVDGLMFGDVGLGNIFIKKEDLIQGDLSKISFYWDCY